MSTNNVVTDRVSPGETGGNACNRSEGSKTYHLSELQIELGTMILAKPRTDIICELILRLAAGGILVNYDAVVQAVDAALAIKDQLYKPWQLDIPVIR
jgi:hypothetical protein